MNIIIFIYKLIIMKRQDMIQQLSDIQYHIEDYERRLAAKKELNWYLTENKWQHRQEINQKCLAYWKRLFNRISFKLMYNL